MCNFRLKLQLAAPFFCSVPLTLDALLSAAIFNATGLQGEDTFPLIPLKNEDGIFKGSSLFCSPNYRHVAVGRIMTLKTESDLAPHLFKPNKRSGDYGYIDQKRGDYKSCMNSYPGIESHEVFFWGVGDPEKVVALIADFIPGIGKRANAGAGQIVAVDWMETPDDYSWVTQKGGPARPLPIEIWKKIGGRDDAPTGLMSIALPHWDSPKVEVVFPQELVP